MSDDYAEWHLSAEWIAAVGDALDLPKGELLTPTVPLRLAVASSNKIDELYYRIGNMRG